MRNAISQCEIQPYLAGVSLIWRKFGPLAGVGIRATDSATNQSPTQHSFQYQKSMMTVCQQYEKSMTTVSLQYERSMTTVRGEYNTSYPQEYFRHTSDIPQAINMYQVCMQLVYLKICLIMN